ncbi:hypothetical protein T4D_14026 [Trichinella pseudospiralis]|uniref:Uncharacterized protein n=1 Tax=Trichinella pseudospiralis TaxID=6337 RepID=A0A0V1FIL0_TRIPS|nr:hypothetical protein T4D_14026 [Trichinella pseudospiralis]
MANCGLLLSKLFRPEKLFHSTLGRRCFCEKKPNPSEPFNLMQETLHVLGMNPFRRLMTMLTALKYRNTYDSSFCIPEFEESSVKAFCAFSSFLFEEKFDILKQLMTSEAFEKLAKVMPFVPDNKRWMFDLKEYDIYFCRLYSADMKKHPTVAGGIMLEFLMIYHAFHRRKEFQDQFHDVTIDKISELKHRYILANVRYIKELRPEFCDDWSISYVNYCQIHPDGG